MRIPCPFCGERDVGEFAYLGDATSRRPDSNVPDVMREFVEAIYLRDNAAGPQRELWYHAFGCRSWVEVVRDTRTHHIEGAVLAHAWHGA